MGWIKDFCYRTGLLRVHCCIGAAGRGYRSGSASYNIRLLGSLHIWGLFEKKGRERKTEDSAVNQHRSLVGNESRKTWLSTADERSLWSESVGRRTANGTATNWRQRCMRYHVDRRTRISSTRRSIIVGAIIKLGADVNDRGGSVDSHNATRSSAADALSSRTMDNEAEPEGRLTL